jgi:hypothetical protein
MPSFNQPDPSQDLGVFKYFSSGYYGSGQDSFTRFPGQNPSFFEALTNVMPVARGSFTLRYGYSLFNNPAIGAVKRIYSYQNIASSLRRLLYISGTSVSVSAEDGTGLASVTTSNSSDPRIAVSRDYAFIPSATSPTTWNSGQQSDGKKWHSTGGLSDWGLAQPASAVNVTSTASAGNITLTSTIGRVYAGAFYNSTTGHYSDINVGLGSFASGTAGPALPGTGASSGGGIAWTSPGNVTANDSVFATAAIPFNAGGTTANLQATNFGFAVPGTATIYGITIAVNKRQSATNVSTGRVTDLTVQLLKAGVATGNNKADTVTLWPLNNTAATSTYGGSMDLWGSTWTPADVNGANFGVQIAATHPGLGVGVGNDTVGVDYVQITIIYATGSGANTGAITGKQVALSLPTSNPPAGADKFAILATLDGGDTSTLYLLDTVAVASSTYTDNTPDNVLVTKNIALESDEFGIEHGLVDNGFPPLGLQFPIKHKGRLYGSVQEKLYFSKSLDEITTSTGLVLGRYEEAFPATNFIDISTVQETIRGHLSDGNTLYVGTERHIWRLDGDGPINFSKPEVIFNEVGIINQDCWSVVFAEGQPVGMMWLTPDFRVLKSNFASYQDVGTPIQDVLNSINLSATASIWGGFFSQNAFDVYMLAIPTGSNTTPDTLCVYDLRSGRWLIWTTTDLLSCGLFNINASGTPMWLIGASTGKVYQFLSTATQDRVSDTPQSITATIKTSWLSLDHPTFIKILNELEVMTADSQLLVTIQGASTTNEALTSPVTVISNSSLTTSPNGLYKVYLAGKPATKRYYRFTFTASHGVSEILDGFLVEAVVFSY